MTRLSRLASVRRRLADERGSLTTYFVSAVPAVVMLTGLVVDGSGQIRAMQEANDIAAETARYAGQSIDIGCATIGAEVDVNPPQARLAAQRYIEQHPSGAELTNVSFEGGHTVIVHTQIHYEPTFLGLFGVGAKDIEGEGEAYQYRTDPAGEEYDPDVQDYGACKGW